MGLVANGRSTCLAFILRRRVTQSMDYALHNQVNMAVSRFGSHLYFFVQRKTLQCGVAIKEKPMASEEVGERARYLSTGGLVSYISWLIGGKGYRISAINFPGQLFFSMPAFVKGPGGLFESRSYTGWEVIFRCRRFIFDTNLDRIDSKPTLLGQRTWDLSVLVEPSGKFIEGGSYFFDVGVEGRELHWSRWSYSRGIQYSLRCP